MSNTIDARVKRAMDVYRHICNAVIQAHKDNAGAVNPDTARDDIANVVAIYCANEQAAAVGNAGPV